MNRWATTADSTAEITTGAKAVRPKSPRMTSTANSTPAIGALKIAAIPAADPHAISVFRFASEILKTCPIVDPSADPICTIGPSLPADPPDPSVSAEATVFATATRGRMTPRFVTIAFITSGTPPPFVSCAW